MPEKFTPTVMVGLRILNRQQVDDIERLLKQLSSSAPQELSWEKVGSILSQPNFTIVLLEDPLSGEIVGMSSLMIYSTLMRTVGIVEDVVVDQRYHGYHFGETLMKYILIIAKTKKCSYLSLTSNSKREAANALYLKLGFQPTGKIGESNYYRLNLTS